MKILEGIFMHSSDVYGRFMQFLLGIEGSDIHQMQIA